MNLFGVFLVLLIGVKTMSVGYGQETGKPPKREWFTSHNGSGEESHGHYIMTCHDGGSLQIGETGFIPRRAKILLVKTDSKGRLIWKKQFGTRGHNLGNSVIEVSDGYVVAGALNRDSTILKINKADGKVIFDRTVDNGGVDAVEHIAETPNGFVGVGYINARDRNNTFYTEGEAYLTFFDTKGNKIRGQSLNDSLSHAYRIQLHNQQMIISGLTEDAQDFALLKMNLDGKLIWRKTFGGVSHDHCFGMDLGIDGSIFLTGHTLSGTKNWDTYTMKLDSDGALLWEAKRGNPRGYDPRYIHDETWGIKATADGGCVISAGTGDEYKKYSAKQKGKNSSDQWEAYLIKFGPNGKVDWETTFAPLSDGTDWAAEGIDLTRDGGAIIAIDNGRFGFLKISSF